MHYFTKLQNWIVNNSCLNYPEYCIDIFSPDNDVIWAAAVQRPLTVQSVLSIGLSAQPVRSTILTLGGRQQQQARLYIHYIQYVLSSL